MQSIRIKGFKGIGSDEISLDFGDSNLLICGENGSGKSSIYEALRLAFFYDAIVTAAIPPAYTEEMARGEESKILSGYLHNNYPNDFEIYIDGVSYRDLDMSRVQVSMIGPSAFTDTDSINLLKLIKAAQLSLNSNFFNAPDKLSGFIEDYVNHVLQDVFAESISIKVSTIAPYVVTVNDGARGLSAYEHLNSIFNESKLHLIVFLTFATLARLIDRKIEGSNDLKKQILVLDDIITSLDIANRTLFAKYLITDFANEGWQLVVLTHNVSLYNLITYVNTTLPNTSERKPLVGYFLYETSTKLRAYKGGALAEIKDLKDKIDGDSTGTVDIDSIGNDIRRVFEMRVHTLANLLMIGARGETNYILDYLYKDNLYFNEKLQKPGMEALIDKICSIVNNYHGDLKAKLKEVIDSFKFKNVEIRNTLSELKIYQKVVLHPMSHIAGEKVNYTIKELRMALYLIDKFDGLINKLAKPEELTRT